MVRRARDWAHSPCQGWQAATWHGVSGPARGPRSAFTLRGIPGVYIKAVGLNTKNEPVLGCWAKTCSETHKRDVFRDT